MEKTPCRYLCGHRDLWCMLYCHKTNGPDEVCWEVYKYRKGNKDNEKES